MFRKYNVNDINNIISLEEEIFNSSLGIEYYQNDLDNIFAYHYVLEDERFIGFISSIFDGEIAEILNFGIKKELQGLKYGYKLISMYINTIKEKGGKSIVLEVRNSNIKAINLYTKVGFKTIRIRKNYYNNQEDAYVLELKL